MSDARLREMERRASTGSVEDKARVLTERLRAGTLTRERLELAAYCGDPVAWLVAPPSRVKAPAKQPEDRCEACDDLGAQTVMVDGAQSLDPCPCTDPQNWRFGLWLSGLSRWGGLNGGPFVRAAVAAAREAFASALPCPGGGASWAPDPRGACLCGYSYDAHRNPDKNPRLMLIGDAIAAAEAWIACPCEPCEVAWLEASTAVNDDMGEAAAWAPAAALTVHGHTRRIGIAARLAGEVPVRDAICASLSVWAMGGES
jgi:hypothetical protein